MLPLLFYAAFLAGAGLLNRCAAAGLARSPDAGSGPVLVKQRLTWTLSRLSFAVAAGCLLAATARAFGG